MNKKIIERTIFKELVNHLSKQEITLLLGARQTGKTTLLKELEQFLITNKKIAKENIFYFNLDILSDLEKFQNQTDLINFLKEQIKDKQKIYILVDEAQKVNNPGMFFKGIYDLGLPVKLILTGSASLEIKAKIIESMSGRKRIFKVFPFSFEEFLKTKKDNKFLIKTLSLKSRSKISSNQLKEYLFEYLNYGGYPMVALAKSAEEKRRTLDEIFSSFVEKDIIGLLGIDTQESFGLVNLLTLLTHQIGSLINLEEISSTLKLKRKTIERFIYYLEETFVVKRLTPFYTNIRKEVTKMPKIYFLDLGIKNFCQKIFQDFLIRQDRGQLLENYVFLELYQNLGYLYKLHFWRTQDKSEVDFILRSGDKIIPIEVKTKSMERPEIPRSLRNFIKRHEIKKAFVVNLAYTGKIQIEKAEVEFLLPFEVKKIFF